MIIEFTHPRLLVVHQAEAAVVLPNESHVRNVNEAENPSNLLGDDLLWV